MRRLLTLFFVFVLATLPAMSEPYEFRAPAKFFQDVTISGTTAITGTTTLTTPKITGAGAGTATLQYANSATSRTITIPDPGANSDLATLAGTQTFSGVKTLTTPKVTGAGAGTAQLQYANSATDRLYTFPDAGAAANVVLSEGAKTINGAITLGTPLTVANVNNSVRRLTQVASVNGAGTLADGTTYRVVFHPGRAGSLKQVGISAITPPVGGTSTVKILKNNTTAMTAADFDPTGLVANTISKPALHGTQANLDFTATDTIIGEWVTGTQTTDAVAPGISLEYELTDF